MDETSSDNTGDWSEEQRKKQEREKELLALFLLLRRRTRSRLRALAASRVNGEIDTAGFAESFEEILVAAHAEASSYGRALSGVTGKRDVVRVVREALTGETASGSLDNSAAVTADADDMAFAEAVVTEQKIFLDDFIESLGADEYSVAYASWRSGLYADRLLGTANAAWAETLGNSTVLFYWHLADAQNCPDCPALELGSPYTLDTLPGVPGDGATACGVNCRCWLTTSTGETGFRLPDDDGEGDESDESL